MKKRKGLTLIEVLLTVAIIGILSIPILSIFNMGIKNITSSGKRTKDVLKVQEYIDEEIQKDIEGTDNMKISIPGVTDKNGHDNPVEIKGRFIEIPSEDGKINITTFIPNTNIND